MRVWVVSSSRRWPRMAAQLRARIWAKNLPTASTAFPMKSSCGDGTTKVRSPHRTHKWRLLPSRTDLEDEERDEATTWLDEQPQGGGRPTRRKDERTPLCG
eukprot:2720618-Prymnesium_polylepis.2